MKDLLGVIEEVEFNECRDIVFILKRMEMMGLWQFKLLFINLVKNIRFVYCDVYQFILMIVYLFCEVIFILVFVEFYVLFKEILMIDNIWYYS